MQRDEPRQGNNSRNNMLGVDKRQRNINAGGDSYDQYDRPQAVSLVSFFFLCLLHYGVIITNFYCLDARIVSVIKILKSTQDSEIVSKRLSH